MRVRSRSKNAALDREEGGGSCWLDRGIVRARSYTRRLEAPDVPVTVAIAVRRSAPVASVMRNTSRICSSVDSAATGAPCRTRTSRPSAPPPRWTCAAPSVPRQISSCSLELVRGRGPPGVWGPHATARSVTVRAALSPRHLVVRQQVRSFGGHFCQALRPVRRRCRAGNPSKTKRVISAKPLSTSAITSAAGPGTAVTSSAGIDRATHRRGAAGARVADAGGSGIRDDRHVVTAGEQAEHFVRPRPPRCARSPHRDVRRRRRRRRAASRCDGCPRQTGHDAHDRSESTARGGGRRDCRWAC